MRANSRIAVSPRAWSCRVRRRSVTGCFRLAISFLCWRARIDNDKQRPVIFRHDSAGEYVHRGQNPVADFPGSILTMLSDNSQHTLLAEFFILGVGRLDDSVRI